MVIGDRGYGSLLGCAIGEAMGQPAAFLTPNQIRWYYEDGIHGYVAPDPEVAPLQEARSGEALATGAEDMLRVADMLLQAGRFSPEAFAAAGGVPCNRTAREAAGSGAAIQAAPFGIKYHHDVDVCVQETFAFATALGAVRPAVAGACAVAAAVAACFNEENSLDDILNIATDAAVYGERNTDDLCGPSVSRRIRMAKKTIDGAKGASLNYLIDELTGVFGAGSQAWDSVPLAIGLFYAAGGDAATGIPAAVNAGDAADTNAALCGALCGAHSGIAGIPKEWIAPVKEALGRDLKAVSRQLLRRM